MKGVVLAICLFAVAGTKQSYGQSHELQQLALNLEKLNQFKAILDQMKKGYQIVARGYTTVKQLTEGNFSLHKLFLDKLLTVNPIVKQYKKVAGIIALQKTLVKEYLNAQNHFVSLKVFDDGQLNYIGEVYDNLFDQSVRNLDELMMIVTSNRLRMNDAERLHAIDGVFAEMEDMVSFLRDFNNRTALLGEQKFRELQETKSLKRLYGLE